MDKLIWALNKLYDNKGYEFWDRNDGNYFKNTKLYNYIKKLGRQLLFTDFAYNNTNLWILEKNGYHLDQDVNCVTKQLWCLRKNGDSRLVIL